jgi:L-aspartate oxidase
MTSPTENTDGHRVALREAPLVVVGSGVAGLSAALGHGDCIVLSKTELGDGSSRWAQGGIAAALGREDDPGVHAADTLRVSAGLERPDIVSMVTAAGPDRIRWLIELGARFDRDAKGELALGREAGHARHRIVHANGDATGAEVMRTLVEAVRIRPDIETLDRMLALDLIIDAGRVVGVLAADHGGRLVGILAPSIVLATGGLGRLYLHTTNPHEVTADGLAMAARAGVAIRDAEFVQFHPTALDSTLDPMPLLTEALRGEGAHLVDGDGRRFMLAVHDDAELAPRDVVARQIWLQRRRGPVYLDARMIGSRFPDRFPTVWQIAQRAGFDPRVDLLPVSPAEHFHMGGIATDQLGRASVPGLYACGEVSSTGLHGANRLASNSLLEGLVFGARVAEAVTDDFGPIEHQDLHVPADALDLDFGRLGRPSPDIDELRAVMWDSVGVVRDENGLRTALARIGELRQRLADHPIGRNLADAALLVTRAALDRTESRGSHARADHTATSAVADHTVQRPEPVPTTRIRAAAPSAEQAQA